MAERESHDVEMAVQVQTVTLGNTSAQSGSHRVAAAKKNEPRVKDGRTLKHGIACMYGQPWLGAIPDELSSLRNQGVYELYDGWSLYMVNGFRRSSVAPRVSLSGSKRDS